MSSYFIGLIWQRATPDFDVKTFNRDYVWRVVGGQMMVARMIPRPRVSFGGATSPDANSVRELHRKAKENCLIGYSLLSQWVLEPRF